MASIDVCATKSLTISNQQIKIDNNYITIGNCNCCLQKYISYLYFCLPPIPQNSKIIIAKLVLFKANNFYDPNCNLGSINKDFRVFPLLDYFSSKTEYFCRPAYEFSISKQVALKGTISIEIDITEIVSKWINGYLINKGIVLKNAKFSSEKFCYGSASIEDNTLVPLLKIFFQDCSLPIIDLKCVYKVVPSINNES